MFYKMPLQIQTIEGALKYKIAPLTPPNLHFILKVKSLEKVYWIEKMLLGVLCQIVAQRSEIK